MIDTAVKLGVGIAPTPSTFYELGEEIIVRRSMGADLMHVPCRIVGFAHRGRQHLYLVTFPKDRTRAWIDEHAVVRSNRRGNDR